MPPSPISAPNSQLLLLVGPTASGKTSVAIELCELLNGEVISADSLLIYRGLDIATAKPTRAEQARARHHLVDILEPDGEYSAAQWASDARAAIIEIRARGKEPIIVGGTGFYINALLRPQLLALAPPDSKLRAELETLAAQHGPGVLHARLQELDAQAAARLHPNDVMRVSRAIEVALFQIQNADKKELSALEYSRPDDSISNEPLLEYSAFALEMPRELLYARINARVDAMLQNGFDEELNSLLAKGYGETAALKSLGYKQMRACLENPNLENSNLKNELQRDDCIADWKRETRRYAKRQGTWFRHQLETKWISAMRENDEMKSAREIAAEIAANFRGA